MSLNRGPPVAMSKPRQTHVVLPRMAQTTAHAAMSEPPALAKPACRQTWQNRPPRVTPQNQPARLNVKDKDSRDIKSRRFMRLEDSVLNPLLTGQIPNSNRFYIKPASPGAGHLQPGRNLKRTITQSKQKTSPFRWGPKLTKS